MAEALLFPLTEDGSTLSKEMAVRPLMKGEIVRYKLIESDEDDLSRTDVEGRRHMKKTPGYTMVGKKVIFDPIARKSVTIMNKPVKTTNKTPLGDIQVVRPASVKFLSDKPIVEVHDDQPELYAFLERANENRDNPFRKKRGSKPKYYRVDARKKLAMDVEKDGFEVAATQWVWREATLNELKACANYANSVNPTLNIKTDFREDEATIAYDLLKRELFALAKKDPHLVIKGSSMIGEQMRLQIIDAERYQIIIFGDARTTKVASKTNAWFFNDADLTTICAVEAGKNKHEALLEFLAKDADGKKYYTKIIESLKLMLTTQ